MDACRNFKIREIDRKTKTFLEDWRTHSKSECEEIYYLLVDDAPAEILDRYYAGKSLLVFTGNKDYQIIKR